MLYGKIYLDNVDGREALVFTSLIVTGEESCLAECVDYIAISPEAREVFTARLRRDCPTLRLDRHLGAFELYGSAAWEHGYFSFKATSAEDGLRMRTLFESDILSLCLARGSRREVLDYMVPCDNDTLKALDLRERVDENMLWEAYFKKKRAIGEAPGCDADTIKKTPLAFLTEAQAAAIESEYRRLCGQYTDQEWRYHADLIGFRISTELMEKYCKSNAAIRGICHICD